MRRLAILFLAAQGVGVAVWWLAMLMFPAARGPFMAPGAPDSTLLAFVLPDLALYSGASLLAAYGLGRNTAWAWPALCLHSGAAIYAALYGLALPLFSGGGWLGAAMMSPSLIVLPFLLWRLRPGMPR